MNTKIFTFSFCFVCFFASLSHAKTLNKKIIKVTNDKQTNIQISVAEINMLFDTVESLSVLQSKANPAYNGKFSNGLFFDQNYNQIFQQATKYNSIWSKTSKSALFTSTFLKVFANRDYISEISYSDIFNDNVSKEHENKLNKIAPFPKRKFKSPGVLKRIVFFLFEGKDMRKFRKGMKQSFKDKSLADLNGVIKPIANNEKKLASFLDNRPTVYYFTRAISEEAANHKTIQDSVKIGECFCTAYEILNKGMNTDKDYGILNKIQSFSKKNNDHLGIEKAGGRFNWLQTKCNVYRAYLGNEKRLTTHNITKLQKQRNAIENSLFVLRDSQNIEIRNIKTLDDKLSANDTIIIKTEQNMADEELTVLYSIGKVPTTQNGRDCLNKTVNKLANGIPLTQDCEKLLAPHVTVEISKNMELEVNAYRGVNANGYELGESCNENIKLTTRLHLKPLLKSIQKTPFENRDQLEIQLHLQGTADAEKCHRCHFISDHSANYHYLDKDGNLKSFTVVKGKSQKITNEQLAFGRALCALSESIALLTGFGINPDQVKVEFSAIVRSEKGEKYRGVSIAFEIGNLFKHYKDEIDKLNNDNLILRNELAIAQTNIKRLEERIFKHEQRIEEINNKIAEKALRLAYIDEQMKNISEEGLDKNLIEILMIRGKSKVEAKNYLKQH